VNSPLVVGLSYRTTPMALLERAALDAAAARDLAGRLCAADHVAEALVLSTCNRLEVYAAVGRFHAGLAAVGDAIAEATGIDLDELTEHLYVHYEASAIEHVFSVAAGLDSMAVGEQQILGQVRAALKAAQEDGTVSRSLTTVLERALRVGKRAHAETELDRAGAGLIQAGLHRAEQVIGPLEQAHALVLGAGAMSGLAVATLQRAGVGTLTVVNRTPERARRLAEAAGGRTRDIAELEAAMAESDLILACTGATGHLIDAAMVKGALAARGGRPQVYADLALPRDIEPEVADLDGAVLVDLEALGRLLAQGGQAAGGVQQARVLVGQEVQSHLATQHASQVAPTVAALRGMARGVVEVELDRLRGRLRERWTDAADERVLAELEQTVHRVVEKLLHTPTVRVKELASEPDGPAYAQALRQLFDLDLGRVEAVTTPITLGGGAS